MHKEEHNESTNVWLLAMKKIRDVFSLCFAHQIAKHWISTVEMPFIWDNGHWMHWKTSRSFEYYTGLACSNIALINVNIIIEKLIDHDLNKKQVPRRYP